MDRIALKSVWLFVLFFIMSVTESPAFEERNLPVASDAITFEQNFNSKSLLAEMSVGAAAPLLIFGRQNFAKGMNGYSLICGKGGAKIRYSSEQNISFDKPGTVSLWFFTDNWQKGVGEPRTVFFATECSKGYIGVETENAPKSASPLERKIILRILYSAILPNTRLALPAIGVKGDNMWHLLVFAWSGSKVYISLDGGSFSSKDFVNEVSAQALPSTSFSIGADTAQNYLLDEVRIYSKKLSDMEVKAIWERGNIEINESKKKEIK